MSVHSYAASLLCGCNTELCRTHSSSPWHDLHRNQYYQNDTNVVYTYNTTFSQSLQLLSHVRLFMTLWTAAHQVSLSITNSQSLLKLMSVEPVMPSNHLILYHLLLLLPSIFPGIRVFSNESVLLIRWPKYWSLSFSISPSNGYSGLISFRMDWLDLLAVLSMHAYIHTYIHTYIYTNFYFSFSSLLWNNCNYHNYLYFINPEM